MQIMMTTSFMTESAGNENSTVESERSFASFG